MSTKILSQGALAVSQSGVIIDGVFYVTMEEIADNLASITVKQLIGLELNRANPAEQFVRIPRIIPEAYRPTLETHVGMYCVFAPPYTNSYDMFVSVETDGSIKFTKPYASTFGSAPDLFGNAGASGTVGPEFTFIIGQLRV